jgi:hypothetical protein
MRSFKLLTATAFALLTLIFLASPTPSHAQEPRYLHALSNLRQARDWLQWDHNPHTADARRHAWDEIDKAIDEVKKAARDDGKDAHFTPPPDARAEGGGAIRSARDLLGVAFEDVKYGYDNPMNAGLQERAKQHIAEARRICESILHP